MWISGRRGNGVIVKQSQSPRSFIVSNLIGELQRNRRHLTQAPDTEKNANSRPEQTPQQEMIMPTQSTSVDQL